MSFSEIPGPEAELEAMITQAVAKIASYIGSDSTRWLLVDTARQRLVLINGRTPVGAWPVSTARVGLDNRQDSGGTPPGVHRVAQKIGAGCPLGTVFASRRDTGRIWPRDAEPNAQDDLILTRVLTLTGCEPGLNQGPGVDSEARYIYLHGTNDEAHIGEPVSHGCVRLTNADIVQVFDLINEGDPVVVV